MLIQLIKIEILQFLLQSELIYLSVKMELRLKLRFGVMDLLVMDVALNPLIQDFCLFVSLPSVFNNKVMLTWMCCSIQATLNTINLPLAYTKYYSVVSNNMGDFQDGAIATVTTYSYNLSQIQIANSWYNTWYAGDVYIICIGF